MHHRGLAHSFYTERDEPIASVLTRTLLETKQEVPEFLDAYKPQGDAIHNLKFEADSDWDEHEAAMTGGGGGGDWGDAQGESSGWGNQDVDGDKQEDGWGTQAGAEETAPKKSSEVQADEGWGKASGGGSNGWGASGASGQQAAADAWASTSSARVHEW